MKKREHRLFIRVTDEERNRILDKMYGMGIHSLSAYIRKMALDGYCLNLDLPQLRRMAYLLQNCSNNLNQVAKRANENGKMNLLPGADRKATSSPIKFDSLSNPVRSPPRKPTRWAMNLPCGLPRANTLLSLPPTQTVTTSITM